ncbi:hypothetical protein EON80_31595 [bacterium]|nr:MAG: hypothetical protein EON80_31595 [bacterium]
MKYHIFDAIQAISKIITFNQCDMVTLRLCRSTVYDLAITQQSPLHPHPPNVCLWAGSGMAAIGRFSAKADVAAIDQETAALGLPAASPALVCKP